MTTTTIRQRAIEQLDAAGLMSYVLVFDAPRDGEDVLRGTMLRDVLPVLRADCYDEHDRPTGHFREGPCHWLHPEIGGDPTEFRSEQDAFGAGSLQIVIDQRSGDFCADVDRFAAYQDARGAIGHLFGEVLPHAARRVWRWLKEH